MVNRRFLGLFFAGALVASLAACGDDNDNLIPDTPTPVDTVRPTDTNTPSDTNTPTETPPPTVTQSGPTNTPVEGGDDFCGDGDVTAGEDCDMGADNGAGLGCAVNCTTEVDRRYPLSSDTKATAQLTVLAIDILLGGQLDLKVGGKRDDVVVDPEGNTITGSGQIPLAAFGSAIQLDPVQVPGLFCVCVRGVNEQGLTSGIALEGRIGCGSDEVDVDYFADYDHNTDDSDPNCDDGEREGCTSEGICHGGTDTGLACGSNDDCNSPHPGVCNRLVEIPEFSPGSTRGQGHGFVSTRVALGLLADGGVCNVDTNNPEKGPDGIPCTDDDPDFGATANAVLTTGVADASLQDVGNNPGFTMSKEVACGAVPCATTTQGRPFDCADLENGTGDIPKGNLVASFMLMDGPQGDLGVTVDFATDLAP